MPLSDFIFRCPECGQDPVRGEKERVGCPACGVTYRRGGDGARIVVERADGSRHEVPAWELADALEGSALQAAWEEGSIRYGAAVQVRRLQGEEPVYFRGRILGFAERVGPAREGSVEVTGSHLAFTDAAGGTQRWPLLDLRAVQTSSKSLQIVPVEGPMVQLRFPDDSPRRWEALLHTLLRRAWRRAGRGEITEFQPRISTR